MPSAQGVRDAPAPESPRADGRGRTTRGLTAAFVGYDAFVSYARSDAARYARARLWHVSVDAPPRRLAVHDNDLSDAVYSADGRWFATADSDSMVQVFSTQTYRPVGRRFAGTRVALGRDELITSGGRRP